MKNIIGHLGKKELWEISFMGKDVQMQSSKQHLLFQIKLKSTVFSTVCPVIVSFNKTI